MSHFGAAITFAFNSAVVSIVDITVMTVILYFLLPETKGVPIEETGLLWRKHKFWRRIVRESNDAEESLLEER
ncbi:hypothetical protein V2J09_021346 [Rumex salicifolius]